MRALRGAVRLAEALEDMRQKLRLDAVACIGDNYLQVLAHPTELDVDPSLLRREFDCVGEQVPNHLLQTHRFTEDKSRILIDQSNDLDFLCLCRRTHPL